MKYKHYSWYIGKVKITFDELPKSRYHIGIEFWARYNIIKFAFFRYSLQFWYRKGLI